MSQAPPAGRNPKHISHAPKQAIFLSVANSMGLSITIATAFGCVPLGMGSHEGLGFISGTVSRDKLLGFS